MRSSVLARSGCFRMSPASYGCAVLRELRQRGRILLEVVGLTEHAGQRARQAMGDLEAVARQRRPPARPGPSTASSPVPSTPGAGRPPCRARRPSDGCCGGVSKSYLPSFSHISGDGAGRRRPRGSRTTSARRSPARKTMKPPPPMLPAVGWVTASAKAVATAASMALPPLLMTWKPTSEAMSFCDTTIPVRARAGASRPAGTARRRRARQSSSDEQRGGS